MLREIRQVRQIAGQHARRWFTDDNWDLFVWHEGPKLLGFQLTYDKDRSERAITWMEGEAPRLSRIDSGKANGTAGGGMKTPILREDRGALPADIVIRFHRDSAKIDAVARRYVFSRLRVLVAEDAR
ncbi:MAG: hypothetical protein E4H09_01520 [Spirochaetales bacterium]|nr:MAG: hypothetical protein E4H09_01520 [Spirochaetales bacterium]